MSKFYISGFADEIDADFATQLKALNGLKINFIEIRGVNGKNISTLSSKEIAAVKNQLEQYGIKVSSIGSPVGKIKISDNFSDHMEVVKRILEMAQTLGSQYVRIFSFYLPKGDQPQIYRNEVIDRLGTILETANGSGLTILHENEKEIYGDTAERCLDLMEVFQGSDLFCVFDPANFIQCGCEVFPKAFNMLKPYIKYVHIKDALKDGRVVPAGMGEGQLENVLKELKRSGYEGFLSLEPHLGEFAGLSELEHKKIAVMNESSGPQRFALAYTSLKSILTRIQGGHNI